MVTLRPDSRTKAHTSPSRANILVSFVSSSKTMTAIMTAIYREHTVIMIDDTGLKINIQSMFMQTLFSMSTTTTARNTRINLNTTLNREGTVWCEIWMFLIGKSQLMKPWHRKNMYTNWQHPIGHGFFQSEQQKVSRGLQAPDSQNKNNFFESIHECIPFKCTTDIFI